MIRAIRLDDFIRYRNSIWVVHEVGTDEHHRMFVGIWDPFSDLAHPTTAKVRDLASLQPVPQVSEV